ncbi:hypothetical protein chiPu_0024556, partial [Chiloscyllium punctatum]|nr:hypothetical protein [Chiloscyllium punctatum]
MSVTRLWAGGFDPPQWNAGLDPSQFRRKRCVESQTDGSCDRDTQVDADKTATEAVDGVPGRARPTVPPRRCLKENLGHLNPSLDQPCLHPPLNQPPRTQQDVATR